MNFTQELPNGFYLALVYLVISGNYLGNLFGCRIQQIFRENMWVKHLLGLFTTFFLIILAMPPEGYTMPQTAGLTGIIYAWFFLTTKMHVKFWIPMIAAAMFTYGLHVWRTRTAANAAADAQAADKERDQRMEMAQRVAVLFGVIVTVLGVVAYFGEKRLEYGDQFDAWTFWTGVPECRFATPPVSITTSLLAAFGARA